MRVIAGKYGSRPLRSVGKLDLRPTSDRLRETLFNILGPAVTGSVFVDLYAGTGAVGIEALSRGADEVVFVEKHPAAVKLIRSNLRLLGVRLPGDRPGRPRLVKPAGAEAAAKSRSSTVEFPSGEPSVELLATDVVKALDLLRQNRIVADFVFLDPPYAAVHEYERALEALSSAYVLARTGRVIVETMRAAKRPPARGEASPQARLQEVMPARGASWFPPDRIGGLELTRTVEQGDSLLVFYRLALAA